ncbi:hypothetical protein [Candidatus Electronema sp. PJ]|uniref:hypothetical protein n=1 Tax=Candidatus Electronema sp. PJ TaxID=3401572 RepID=UPI003AA9AA09
MQTASGKYVIVHVFPKECVDKKPALFVFRKGEQVEARGIGILYPERQAKEYLCRCNYLTYKSETEK